MSMARAHLLVVGGNGFIGRKIVERAVQLGWSVVSLSRSLPQSRPDWPDVTWLAGDLTEPATLAAALGGQAFTHVVNAGGYVDHTPFHKGGDRLIAAHFLGVANLVRSLDRSRLQRFVNIGSSDEYGGLPAPQREDLREGPASPYSLGKTAATHFLQMLHRAEGFPAATLRVFLTYGPGQDSKRFIPQIVLGCLRDAEFPTSAGEQLRDFCYIEDLIDAVFLALESAQASGEIYNVGSGVPTRVRAMVEAICRLTGKGRPQWGKYPYRPGESMALYADIGKIHRQLGWTPRISLDTGLQATVNWLRTHGPLST
jgi:nucleoside-diphosphate-sugar epimerase